MRRKEGREIHRERCTALHCTALHCTALPWSGVKDPSIHDGSFGSCYSGRLATCRHSRYLGHRHDSIETGRMNRPCAPFRARPAKNDQRLVSSLDRNRHGGGPVWRELSLLVSGLLLSTTLSSSTTTSSSLSSSLQRHDTTLLTRTKRNQLLFPNPSWLSLQ